MTLYANGLVVGKFAPLHAGHEALINTALEQCETVCIISYSSPEIRGYEPEKRLNWLTTRFRNVATSCFRRMCWLHMALRHRHRMTLMTIFTGIMLQRCVRTFCIVSQRRYLLPKTMETGLPLS